MINYLDDSDYFKCNSSIKHDLGNLPNYYHIPTTVLVYISEIGRKTYGFILSLEKQVPDIRRQICPSLH